MNELTVHNNLKVAELLFDKLDVRPSTRQDYKYRIRHFMNFLSNHPVNTDSLLDYKNYLRADDRLSISTKNKFLTCARTFLREVQRHRELTPFTFNLDIKCFQQNKKHKVFGLDEYDVTLLCQWMNRNPDKLREHAILCLLLFQGLREMEVCNINFFEVDLEDANVLIRSKGMDDKETIYLHPQTVRALSKYMEQRRNVMKPSETYLFVSERKRSADEALTIRGLRYIVKGIFNELGIARNVHGTRHYFTTHLIQNMPGSLLQVAQFTRHKNITTLQTYHDGILDKENVAQYQNAFNDIAGKLFVEPAI
jgi:site-specific recombinase XerD